MPLGLLGKKVGMTQVFDQDGSVIPVTIIEAGPCPVVLKRTADVDGYDAVQIGFGAAKAKNVTKPEKGHFAKAGVEPVKLIREIRGEETSAIEVGQTLSVEMFEEGEKVDIIGQSKGRGFSSVRKRWGSSTGPKTHGSMYHNKPGANGQASDPSRVFKGKKQSGQLGAERVTLRNIKIVKTDAGKNLIILKGSVPGANGGYIMIRKAR